MSDLLHIGLTGVSAYRTALTAIGDNVANAETPGYARRDVRLREPVSGGVRTLGFRSEVGFRGVEVTAIDRAWDSFRAADARYSAAAAGRADIRERWLTSVETALADGDAGVGTLLGKFFNAGVALAANPGDTPGRQAMLYALESAAGAIRDTATGLARVAEGIAGQAQTETDALNLDLKALAGVNTELKKAAPGTAIRASLEDERDRLIDSVAKRVDVTASIAADGQAKLTLSQSTATTLIEGDTPALVSVAIAADGRLDFQIGISGTAMQLPLSGGSLAGLKDVSATTADRRRTLDQIAADFVTQVNAWSAQGRKADGTAGGNLLSIAGGAATIQLTATDPAAIATASADGRENGNLLALTQLRGNTSVEARWTALVASNAQTLASAKYEAAAAYSRRDDSYAALDMVTGVDLDREAAELMRYQQAYNGASKIIQVARETMQTILDLF